MFASDRPPNRPHLPPRSPLAPLAPLSKVHRVLNMKATHRYSIPFFFNPTLDAEIACLPTCLKEGETESEFAPSTCEEILMSRYAETFSHISEGKGKA